MVDSVNTTNVSTTALDYAQQRSQVPTQTTPDVSQTASDVLDVGKNFWSRDDYDARAEAFAQEMQKGDAEYQKQLVAEVLRQDPGAFSSWLNPGRINDLVDSGKISQTQRNDMAAGIAGAYNDGTLPSNPIHDANGNVVGTESALDAFLYNRNSTSTDGVDNQIENARNLREFAEFFSGPHYNAEISEFRENYSEHLIKDYALNDKVSDGDLRNRAAVGAASVLNGDPTRGDIAANVLNGLEEGQLASFMERVANGSELVSPAHIDGIIGNSTVAYRDGLQTSDVALPDQFSSLVAQVSRTDTAASREVAADIARLPAQKPEIFAENRTGNYQERVDAMGQLFTSHSEPILNELTKYDLDKAGSVENSTTKQYMQNASDLGSLLNVVVFNKDSTYAGTARAEIMDYAADLKQQINTTEGSADAMERLAMLSGAADDAITQGFNDLKSQQEAQKELVSFIVDVALAGVPLDKLKGGVSDYVGEIFSNPRVSEALKGVTGELVDSGTGKLTDAAKEALASALGPDAAELLDQQQASNALRNAIQGGITDQRDIANVRNYAEDVTQGINIWRSQ
ncbi:hypothetical protein ACQQ2N_00790 [Dokdonella sp. MW10]|uniref:hypothetical protein n=1 Tax=Dokdonella sp. MW10 TaxID=2992926 RepID=UPI003F8187E5